MIKANKYRDYSQKMNWLKQNITKVLVKEVLLKEVNNLKLKKKKKQQRNNWKLQIKKRMIVHFHQESIHKQIKRVVISKNLEISNNFYQIKTNMYKIRK